MKLELNSNHDAKNDGESFSAQIVDKTKEDLADAESTIHKLKLENNSLGEKIVTLESKRERLNSEKEGQQGVSQCYLAHEGIVDLAPSRASPF